MSKNERMVGISRRTLVKSTAIGSLALAAGGFSLPFTLRNAAAAVQRQPSGTRLFARSLHPPAY